MNRQRRKAIDSIREAVEALRQPVADIISDLESVRDEEQEYVDNMPEGLQDSEKAQIAGEAVEALERVLEAFEEVDFDDLVGALEEAQA